MLRVTFMTHPLPHFQLNICSVSTFVTDRGSRFKSRDRFNLFASFVRLPLAGGRTTILQCYYTILQGHAQVKPFVINKHMSGVYIPALKHRGLDTEERDKIPLNQFMNGIICCPTLFIKCVM